MKAHRYVSLMNSLYSWQSFDKNEDTVISPHAVTSCNVTHDYQYYKINI